jgi:hypothetical protein
VGVGGGGSVAVGAGVGVGATDSVAAGLAVGLPLRSGPDEMKVLAGWPSNGQILASTMKLPIAARAAATPTAPASWTRNRVRALWRRFGRYPGSRIPPIRPLYSATVRGATPGTADGTVLPPLKVIVVVETHEEVVLAQDTRFGLCASLFTASLDEALRFVRDCRAGVVKVNQETARIEFQAPFGGMKDSSSSSREQGKAARDFMTEWRPSRSHRRRSGRGGLPRMWSGRRDSTHASGRIAPMRVSGDHPPRSPARVDRQASRPIRALD